MISCIPSIEFDYELKILSIYGFIYGFLLIASILYFFKSKNKYNLIDHVDKSELNMINMSQGASQSEEYERDNLSTQVSKYNPTHSNLHNRMKMYETYTEYNISHVGQETPFIVRLKGRNFKSIKINEYNNSMILLGSELMKEFHAHTSMVFDDELILIFPQSFYHQFNGNCMKLQSIIASYAASSLTLKLNTLCSFYTSIVNFPKQEFMSQGTLKNKDFEHKQSIDLSYELLYYIKWRINRAKSIHSDVYFIKKQMKDNLYNYVKFGLSHIKYDDNYINLFTSPILNTNIKLKKLSNIN
jgi:hypothetical protein